MSEEPSPATPVFTHIDASATARIDDHEPFVEELAGELCGSAEVAAAVALEVDDEVAHALLLQAFDGSDDLFVGGGSEIGEAHEAYAGFHDIGCVERRHGNLVALDVEGERAVDAAADYAELHLRTLGPAQSAHDVLAAHLDARDGRVVDQRDAVAGNDAGLLRRSFGHGLDDYERVVEHIELHAYAVEVALQRLVELLRVLGVGIGRVRVELREHARDGVLHLSLYVDGVDIHLVDHDGRLQQLTHGQLARVQVCLCRERKGNDERYK